MSLQLSGDHVGHSVLDNVSDAALQDTHIADHPSTRGSSTGPSAQRHLELAGAPPLPLVPARHVPPPQGSPSSAAANAPWFGSADVTWIHYTRVSASGMAVYAVHRGTGFIANSLILPGVDA